MHHLMNEDLKQAYELAKTESSSLVQITPALLQRLNATLMRTTGSVRSVMGGSFDSSNGDFPLCGSTAGQLRLNIEHFASQFVPFLRDGRGG